MASLASMVATSELLGESFDRPAAGRLDPPPPANRGRPGVIQVEPPTRGSGEASRPFPAPAAEPPPRRSARGGAAPEGRVLRRPGGSTGPAVPSGARPAF